MNAYQENILQKVLPLAYLVVLDIIQIEVLPIALNVTLELTLHKEVALVRNVKQVHIHQEGLQNVVNVLLDIIQKLVQVLVQSVLLGKPLKQVQVLVLIYVIQEVITNGVAAMFVLLALLQFQTFRSVLIVQREHLQVVELQHVKNVLQEHILLLLDPLYVWNVLQGHIQELGLILAKNVPRELLLRKGVLYV